MPGAQAEQLDAPGAEEVCWKPALHWHTVCAVKVHAPPEVCVCVAPSHAEQGVHALDCEPATEYVLAAQLSMVVSAVEVQAAVTRLPGPAAKQAVHEGVTPSFHNHPLSTALRKRVAEGPQKPDVHEYT